MVAKVQSLISKIDEVRELREGINTDRNAALRSLFREITAPFLCFYFLTREGLEKIGEASPGGAGRNRTLGLKKLDALEVPVPPLDMQRHFDRIHLQMTKSSLAEGLSMTKLNALLLTVLDRAFKGRL